MATTIVFKGGGSANKADVDTNKNLMVTPPAVLSRSGKISGALEPDSGSITGTRAIRQLDPTQDFRQRFSFDLPLFNAGFPGTALNINRWTWPLSGMTVNVSGQTLTMNYGSSGTLGNYSILQSWRTFPFYLANTTYAEFEMLISSRQTNNTVEWGFGFVSGATATPTAGVFWRYNGLTNTIQCVVNDNGTETFQTIDTGPTVNNRHHWIIGITSDEAEFWCDNTLYANISALPTWTNITGVATMPVFVRVYNNDNIGTPVQVKLYHVEVAIGGMQGNKPYSHVQAGNCLNALHFYDGATSLDVTSNLAGATYNSLAPTQITGVDPYFLDNTHAAYTTLGGDFRIIATTVNSELDMGVFGFLNPATSIGASSVTGRPLYITGITISTINWGAVSDATNRFTIQWNMGTSATQLDLSVTDTAIAKISRRINLGNQSIPLSAAVGVPFTPMINTQFTTPYLVAPGDYFHIIQRTLTAVSPITSGQYIRGLINVNGYWG
jgi:hypothetical protein